MIPVLPESAVLPWTFYESVWDRLDDKTGVLRLVRDKQGRLRMRDPFTGLEEDMDDREDPENAWRLLYTAWRWIPKDEDTICYELRDIHGRNCLFKLYLLKWIDQRWQACDVWVCAGDFAKAEALVINLCGPAVVLALMETP